MSKTSYADVFYGLTESERDLDVNSKGKKQKIEHMVGIFGSSKLSQMQTTPNTDTHSLLKPIKGSKGVFRCSEPAEHSKATLW